jgi:hypothetical protein
MATASASTTTTNSMTNNIVRQLDNPSLSMDKTSSTVVQVPTANSNDENNVILHVSKLYLHSLIRPPSVTNIGLYEFWSSLSYEDYNNNNLHQSQSTMTTTGSTDSDDKNNIDMSSLTSIEKIYNSFRTCRQYKPEIINEQEKKHKQQQQQQLQAQKEEIESSKQQQKQQPSITFPGSSTLTTYNTYSYLKAQDEEQKKKNEQQQQVNNEKDYNKARDLLIQVERKNIYNDCLSHVTCPKHAIKYHKCWKRTIHLLNQQQLKQQQQHNVTDIEQKQKQQIQIEQSIQFWKQLKEEGYLNSICIHEREDIERCIGTTIKNGNYERQ